MQVVLKNKKIHYEIRGTENPKILLVHGWGGSSKSLNGMAEILSKKATVISMDLPGFGESDLPESDWGVTEFAQTIVDFLDALKINNCVYFGHSFGGALGVYLAAKHPSVIEKLIICAASFKRKPAKQTTGIKALIKNQLLLNPKIKRLLYKVFFPRSDAYKFPELETNFRKIITQDLTPLLKDIDQETLVLWGDQDTYVNVSDTDLVKRDVKKSTIRIYKGYSHAVPLTDPEMVCGDIAEFLEI